MAAVALKKLIGEAGAGLDSSSGKDNLLDVLTQLITEHNALVVSHNQLIVDYDAETVASHTSTTAAAITGEITIE
ncbi:MAG: hypothetical protein ACTSX8_00365 [Alphaproteobacteria bacterium]